MVDPRRARSDARAALHLIFAAKTPSRQGQRIRSTSSRASSSARAEITANDWSILVAHVRMRAQPSF
jgi:hypothetical protein